MIRIQIILLFLFTTLIAKSQYSTDSVVNSFIVEWKSVPYHFGGETKKGIDCSAFSQKFYKQVYNIDIPRTCYYQKLYSKKVEFDQLMIGDIIFFNSSTSPSKRHCGVYIGGGNFVHAANYKLGVIISCIYDKLYFDRIIYIGRYY